MSSSNHDNDTEFGKIEPLKWKPWVGENYYLGKKLLIVGESHYSWTNEKDTPEKVHSCINDPAWTRIFVENHGIKGINLNKHPVLRNIEKTLFNPQSATVRNRQMLWRCVSYYNFVQEPMDTIKHRPQKDDWQKGWNTFFKVVDILKPNYILFCGVSALNEQPFFYEALKNNAFKCDKGIRKKTEKIGRTYLRTRGEISKGDHKASISCISHPSRSPYLLEWSSKVVETQMKDYISWLKEQNQEMVIENT